MCVRGLGHGKRRCPVGIQVELVRVPSWLFRSGIQVTRVAGFSSQNSSLLSVPVAPALGEGAVDHHSGHWMSLPSYLLPLLLPPFHLQQPEFFLNCHYFDVSYILKPSAALHCSKNKIQTS